MSNQTFNTFIATHPIFKVGSFSIPLRKSLVATLMGLGLPIPATHKKSVWGYEKHGDVYYPITAELDALYIALEMNDGLEYEVPDILEWLSKAVKNPPSRRSFFYFKEKRPLFPEYKSLTVEQRIDLFTNVTRTAPATPQEGREAS